MTKHILVEHKIILFLGLIVLSLLSYNFINAQWSAPTAAAPNDNVTTPVNLSVSPQYKPGKIMADSLVAVWQLGSDLYCDGLRDNCIPHTDIYNFINATTLYRTNTQASVTAGQKVSVSCLEEGDGLYISKEMMTGGGCKVIGTYDELTVDEGDIFSYPEMTNSPSGPTMKWTCENKNLGAATIEASVMCLSFPNGPVGGA